MIFTTHARAMKGRQVPMTGRPLAVAVVDYQKAVLEAVQVGGQEEVLVVDQVVDQEVGLVGLLQEDQVDQADQADQVDQVDQRNQEDPTHCSRPQISMRLRGWHNRYRRPL